MRGLRLRICPFGPVSAIAAIFAAIALPAAAKTIQQPTEIFENRVRPVLAERCFGCHSARQAMGGLRLDSRQAMLTGGARGPAIVPGKSGASLLIRAIRQADSRLKMPPDSRLSDEQADSISEWIDRGAIWTVTIPASRPAAKAPFDLQARRKSHWAWQPVRRPSAPSVIDHSWPRNTIDSFILAKLEANGLRPAPPPDKLTLLRRVTFDLIGLPPTQLEIESFLRDSSPDAYAKVVDRLLASPHYGERWARHWLDLVRYAETDGHEFDHDKPNVYQYRDYVIRAFNNDIPYDQFVREHVAGDQIPNPRRNPSNGFNESIIGTGFWWLGEGIHSPVDITQAQRDTIDNQIDVFGKAFLGLTVGCAKCHDHKFDAISTRDYYALTGFLKSSRYDLAAIDPPGRNRSAIADLESLSTRMLALSNGQPAKTVLQPGSATIFEDFSKPGFEGWHVTGDAFGSGPAQAVLAVTSSAAGPEVKRIAERGADSGRFGNRLQGTLRSRTFRIDKPFVFYHLAGQGADVKLIIDGFQRIQAPIYGGLKFQPDDDTRMKWYVMDVSKWIGHEAYVEFIDQGTGRVACDTIAFSDKPSPQEVTARATESLGVRLASSSNTSAVRTLLAERAELELKLVDPTRVLALVDGTGENDRVHIRGNHATLGDEVPRRFLEACAGATQPPVTGDGSGRRELAERMVSPSNTLLARVMVNRLWQHHFGEGIVRSVDDFGVMGQPPTHPELLDWLASEFVRGGWTIKRMQRMMVLSSAYRMSSRADSASDRVDPQNKLVHRMTVRRLEAESVRDAILAVSGRLDLSMYGPSVMPYLTAFMEGRGKPAESGPLDGAGRRSLYVCVRRNFLVPMFLAFDYPVPATCMGRRSVSNVPAQALTLMNNPFVLQQAEVWAKRILSKQEQPPVQRIVAAYLDAFGRPPTTKELSEAKQFLETSATEHGGDQLKCWTDFCHVLYNVKEFIFIR